MSGYPAMVGSLSDVEESCVSVARILVPSSPKSEPNLRSSFVFDQTKDVPMFAVDVGGLSFRS